MRLFNHKVYCRKEEGIWKRKPILLNVQDVDEVRDTDDRLLAEHIIKKLTMYDEYQIM